VRLVCEEIFVKDIGGTSGGVLRAGTEHVVGGAAKHAAAEADRVRAPKVGDGIDRVAGGSINGRWLVALYSCSAGERKTLVILEMSSEASTLALGMEIK
jgi:hypothetical protein